MFVFIFKKRTIKNVACKLLRLLELTLCCLADLFQNEQLSRVFGLQQLWSSELNSLCSASCWPGSGGSAVNREANYLI